MEKETSILVEDLVDPYPAFLLSWAARFCDPETYRCRLGE